MAKMMDKNPEVLCEVVKSGNRYNAFDIHDATKRTSEISTTTRKRAFENDCYLGRFTTSTGKFQWRLLNKDDVNLTVTGGTTPDENLPVIEVPTEHAEVMAFIHGSYSLKPRGLMMSELKWKYLMRRQWLLRLLLIHLIDLTTILT
jgi:hypothetical protein